MSTMLLLFLLALLVTLTHAGSNCQGGLSVSCGTYGCCPNGSVCYSQGNVTACCPSNLGTFCPGSTFCCRGQCSPSNEASCSPALSVCNTPPASTVVCGNLGFCCQWGSYCNGSWNYNAPVQTRGVVYCFNSSSVTGVPTPTPSSSSSGPTPTANSSVSATDSPTSGAVADNIIGMAAFAFWSLSLIGLSY